MPIEDGIPPEEVMDDPGETDEPTVTEPEEEVEEPSINEATTEEPFMGILNKVKKMIGYPPELTEFDLDITTHINAAFAVLTQMGIGPNEGFFITPDGNETLDQFTEDKNEHGMILMVLQLRTKLAFDPPASATVTQTLKDMLNEFEWRLHAAHNPSNTFN